jgi:hypothetical protein
MEGRVTNDLVRIAAAGGGLKFNGGPRTAEDLIRIAAAIANGGGTLYLTGMSGRTTDDIIRIVSVGKGRVVVE